MDFLVEREERLLKEIFDFSDNLPFYRFCGFATHDPKFRGFYTAHVRNRDAEMVVDREGNIRKDFQDKIHENILVALKENKRGEIITK